MSSTTTTNSTSPAVKLIALFTILAGIIMIVAGGATWSLVTSQLKDEHITVAAVTPEAPGALADKPVAGPFTAYAQANAIKHHSLTAGNGKTYAQIGDAAKALKAKLAAAGTSEADIAVDPGVVALATARTNVMNGAFLRTALFSSVISYGVAALVIGLGLIFALLGFAIRSVSTTTVVTEAPGVPSPVGARA
ncbi:hypothetical protein [Pengzhenrongella sp.]|jgi:hypothetical protein|uniref:hypothetical protein n=1 Tax=Pengzhenrongella sp. TaxID=2888820 RepID=UPI002F952058